MKNIKIFAIVSFYLLMKKKIKSVDILSFNLVSTKLITYSKNFGAKNLKIFAIKGFMILI